MCVSKVSDFTWSHDGTQALISYRDGFVLVGSVSGQRHWSSEINLESQITCGIWTPDDQQVMPLEYGCVVLKPWELRRKCVKDCHTVGMGTAWRNWLQSFLKSHKGKEQWQYPGKNENKNLKWTIDWRNNISHHYGKRSVNILIVENVHANLILNLHR